MEPKRRENFIRDTEKEVCFFDPDLKFQQKAVVELVYKYRGNVKIAI